MAVGERAEGVVWAVVADDGQVLLVARAGGWGLPSGTPEPAETAGATAERAVYELTGYLVDGSQPLRPADDGLTVVVCPLLTESPSEGGSLAPEEIRWVPFAEADGAGLPGAARDYLRGHTSA
ncbi:NUDIX domain-containing protein [Streptomyces sp. L2]|uniref:NUDIX hydrolase n=1 Tax=Streptomyces sp. L2 TaxID=2162665 RepID=UPI001010867B|nr:NUDIX domain-containing protein [Streptomyces sp. L2]